MLVCIIQNLCFDFDWWFCTGLRFGFVCVSMFAQYFGVYYFGVLVFNVFCGFCCYFDVLCVLRCVLILGMRFVFRCGLIWYFSFVVWLMTCWVCGDLF